MLFLKVAKKMTGIVIGAAVGALVLTAVLVFAGLTGLVGQVQLRSIGMTLPSWAAVAVGLFFNLLFIGILYFFFGPMIVDKVGEARDAWSDLPDAAKAVLAGLPFAVVAALSVVVTDVLAYSLPAVVRLVVPLVVWLAVTAVSFNHLRSNDALRDLLGTLATATVVGGGLAAAVVLLARLVGSLSLPGYVPLVVLFVTAPLTATLVVRSAQRDDGGYLSALLVKTGFAQVRKIQTLTVSLALGLLVGIGGALLVSVGVGGILVTALSFLVVWLLATYAALRWFQRTDDARSDLVIVDVRDRSSGSRRELAVANERDERVDLRDAKIRDTEYDLYRTNIDVLLAPGQTETFDIPPGFSLFPSTDDLATDLPLGFSLSQSAEAPVIVTRDGEKFQLRWGEGVSGREGQPHQRGGGTPSPDPESREDNV